MNTKENQRTRLSKTLLKNALLDLIAEKGSADKISVRELCERAGLNRSTFYAHYADPRQLLEETEDELLSSASEHLRQIGGASSRDAGKVLLSFLSYIRVHDREFRILLVESADMEFRNKFIRTSIGRVVDSFDIDLPGDLEQYCFSYIINGSAAVIIQWIRSGYAVDEKTLVELLYGMNKNLLESMPR